MCDYFIKLPNSLIWSLEKEEETICKNDDKILQSIIYLNTHYNNILDETYFSLEDIITSCGLKITKGKNGSINQFKETLKYLVSIGWLTNVDIDTIKLKDFVKCNFNIVYDKNDNGDDTHWFKLYYKNYKKIINNNTNLNKSITLKLYCHILARLKRNDSDHDLQTAREYVYHDGVTTESLYDTYSAINKQIGISGNEVLKKHLDLLVDLDLIAYGNIGLVEKDGFKHTANNCYCEDHEELIRALRCSKEYYLKEGYTILGKEVKKSSKTVKGLKGKATQTKNKGQDDTKYNKQIEDIETIENEKAIEKAKNQRTVTKGFKCNRKEDAYNGYDSNY